MCLQFDIHGVSYRIDNNDERFFDVIVGESLLSGGRGWGSLLSEVYGDRLTQVTLVECLVMQLLG